MHPHSQLVQAVNSNLYFVPSYKTFSELTQIFFYHVPKCGGMSLFSAVNEAAENLNCADNLYPIRFDTNDWQADIKKVRAKFIASHQTFGAHELVCDDKAKLITISRQPFFRVLSAYTYSAMREQKPVSIEEFKQFYRCQSNQNVMFKQLSCGLATAQNIEIEAVTQRLKDKFCVFITSDDISELISFCLTELSLCNVLSERLNQTLPEYRLNADCCRAEVEHLNKMDVALHNWIANNKRLPDSQSWQDDIHPKTSILAEVEQLKRSATKGFLAETDLVIKPFYSYKTNGTGRNLTLLSMLGLKRRD